MSNKIHFTAAPIDRQRGKKISHEEVNAALKEYLSRGGKITNLEPAPNAHCDRHILSLGHGLALDKLLSIASSLDVCPPVYNNRQGSI